MATRNPLIYNGSDLIEMTSAQVDAVVDNIVYQYSLSPSVTLTAGAVSNSSSSFPGSGTTQIPQSVTSNYDKVSQAVASVTPTADTGTT